MGCTRDGFEPPSNDIYIYVFALLRVYTTNNDITLATHVL